MYYVNISYSVQRIIFVIVLSNSVFYGCGSSESANLPDPSTNNKNCTSLLAKFATVTANFTHCAIMNARPIKLCESCVQQYLSVKDAHEEIFEEDETGEACRKKLINLDYLEIIEHGYDNVWELWQRGHCDSCFNSNNGNNIGPSNQTLIFNDLYMKTNTCIQSYYYSANKSYDPNVCTSCSDAYCKLNEFYDSLKETEGDGKICVDIIDSMNRTRSKWSTTLKCGRKSLSAEVPLLLSLTFISITPVAFYIAAKIFSNKLESRVIPQKRLGDLNYPSTRSLGS